MAFPVTVVNPSSRPVPVDVIKIVQVRPINTTIQSFSYAIQPLGNAPVINFGFMLPAESILEAVGYIANASPALRLTLLFASWAPPAVLGAVQGANIVPQPDARFHFELMPFPGTSAIGFATMANIDSPGQTRIDVSLATPDGTNIPVTATGVLSLQFHQR